MKKQISPQIVSLVFAVMVVSFAIAFYAVAWEEPDSVPPGDNVPAPLNTGLISQVKEGALGIYGVFRAVGGADPAIEPGLVVNNGNVGIGTTGPNAKLEVKAGSEGQSSPVEAIRIWGPNTPTNANSAQDLKWNFAAAGSAGIRAYRGGSWDTYLQFLTNAVGMGSDNPQVKMHISESGNVGIGTTSPGAKLHVGGTAGIDGIMFPDGTLQITAAAGGGGMPSGAVMFFNLAVCPSEWSELAGARGRYIVGLPSGGALGGTQGTALSNLENRSTGGHYHYGAQGVKGIGARVDRIFPQGGAGSSPSTVSNKGSDGGPSLPALIDTVAGTNAPYIQLLTCQKD